MLSIAENLKQYTNEDGIHAINVFVEKPFIKRAPDPERSEENRFPWKSGELFTLYHDWPLHRTEETNINIDISGFVDKLDSMPYAVIMLILVAAAVVVMATSIGYSLAIMKKKEY